MGMLDRARRAQRLPALFRRGIDLELVGRQSKTGFVVEPRRWRAERSFGCLQSHHGLQVDHEGSTGMSRTVTVLATLFMASARVARPIMAWVFSARL
jgi:hypothetical protein